MINVLGPSSRLCSRNRIRKPFRGCMKRDYENFVRNPSVTWGSGEEGSCLFYTTETRRTRRSIVSSVKSPCPPCLRGESKFPPKLRDYFCSRSKNSGVRKPPYSKPLLRFWLLTPDFW